jgi:hypothetical protein
MFVLLERRGDRVPAGERVVGLNKFVLANEAAQISQ